MISDGLIVKKVAFDSVAHAFARYVLPVPGGPYNNIPFQGFLKPTNIEGKCIGNIIEIFNYYFALSNPAISSHLTLGFSPN
jgi:hypothetical protein